MAEFRGSLLVRVLLNVVHPKGLLSVVETESTGFCWALVVRIHNILPSGGSIRSGLLVELGLLIEGLVELTLTLLIPLRGIQANTDLRGGLPLANYRALSLRLFGRGWLVDSTRQLFIFANEIFSMCLDATALPPADLISRLF